MAEIKIIQMEELCRLCHSRLQITQNIFVKRREADAQAATFSIGEADVAGLSC